MITLDCIQGDEVWVQARLGIPTASCFDRIIKANGERSASFEDYIYDLIQERVTGEPANNYSNKNMDWGHRYEPDARQFYGFVNDAEIQQVGLCYKDEDRKYSCSPDSLVGEDGGLEIKCPQLKKHAKDFEKGVLPSDHHRQVQGCLFVTGRKWWDFMSYFPGCKPLIVRVYPDLRFHEALERELNAFCDQLEETTKRLAA